MKSLNENEEKETLLIRVKPNMATKLRRSFRNLFCVSNVKELEAIETRRVVKICLNHFCR